VPVIAVLENKTGGLSDLQREFRRNHAIGPSANSVGAKIAATHATYPRRPSFGLIAPDAPDRRAAKFLQPPHINVNAVNLLQKL
jgi:hypothetical protein